MMIYGWQCNQGGQGTTLSFTCFEWTESLRMGGGKLSQKKKSEVYIHSAVKRGNKYS